MRNNSRLKLYEKGKMELLELKKEMVFDGTGISTKKSNENKYIVTIEKIHIIQISDSENDSYYELRAMIMGDDGDWDCKSLMCSGNTANYILHEVNCLDSYALIVNDNNKLNLINCMGVNEAKEILGVTDENYRDNESLACYLQCNDHQKQRVLRRIRHEMPPKLGTGIKRDFYPESEDDIWMEYAICKNFVPQDIWERIGALLNIVSNHKLPSSQRNNINRAIEYLLSYSFETRPVKINKADLMNGLNERIYGRVDIKNDIVNAFTIEKNNNGIPRIICITGKGGHGKDLIAKTVAEITSCFFETISIDSSKHETDVFMGTSDIYENCKPGEFAEVLSRIGNSGCMIIDGFKDAKSDIKVNLARALQVGEFTDTMLQVPIPLKDMTFILVSDDAKDIPRNIYNISTKLHLEPYTVEDRTIIAKEYILKNVSREYGIEDLDIRISDEAVMFLSNSYTVTSSMDEVVSNYRKLIGKIMADYDRIIANESKVTVSMKYIKKIFDLGNADINIAKDMSALEKKFKRNRYRFSIDEQTLISDLFEEYYSLDEKNSERGVVKDRIIFAVNFMPSKDTRYNGDVTNVINHIRDNLDNEIYGHEESKKTVLRAVSEGYLERGNLFGTLKLFMYGAAGTGKTSISRTIASALGVPFIKISLNGMTEVEIIKGFSSGFSKSKMSIIAEKLMENGTRRAVILFDEVEKASSSVINALYDIVDPNECKFYDNYLGRYIPTDGLIMIASGNDISKLPAAFIDRFEMVKLSGYTELEREKIARNYVYPRIMRDMGLENRVIIEDSAIKLIAREYVRSGSVRPIEKKLKQVILDSMDSESIYNDRYSVIHISREDVYNSLGALPIKSGNRPELSAYPAGVCNCLGVCGGLGNVFPVEIVKTPYLKKGRITGLPKRVMKDSISNAEIYVSNFLGRPLDTTSILFAEGAVPKDGPSAGIAIATALLSVNTGIPVDKDVAFTGEIDILGYIYAIGGEEEKLAAALSAGITRIFIPYENYRMLDVNNKLGLYREISVIPVRHMSEVIANLFPALAIAEIDSSGGIAVNMDMDDSYNKTYRQVI